MIRTTILLFACGLAVAAPVPKTPPKLEDVFGQIADKKSECKFETNKDGALTIAIPTTHPTLEPGTYSTIPPMVGKTVKGDFVLTARMALALPKADEVKGPPSPPAVMAGISIVPTDTPKTGATIGFVRRSEKGEWKAVNLLTSRQPVQGGQGLVAENKAEVEGKEKPGDPAWLRITRRGSLLEADTSGDGITWATFTPHKVKDWGETVSVGPVAFGNVDKEFTATFDQYEIKPLKEEKK